MTLSQLRSLLLPYNINYLLAAVTILFLMIACDNDDMKVPHENALSGKYHSFQSILSGDTSEIYFYYDTTNGDLLTIATADSIDLYVRIERLSGNKLHLIYADNYTYETTTENGNILRIERLTPTSDYNGIYDWEMQYSLNNILEAIEISMDFEFAFPGNPPVLYQGGLLSQFEYDQNYTGSVFSYYQDGLLQSEQNEFLYSGITAPSMPVVYQYPYYGFAFGRFPLVQFVNAVNPAFIAHLCGYPIFESNAALISEVNGVSYSYQFNGDNQLIRMTMDNIDGLAPWESYIMEFEYYP